MIFVATANQLDTIPGPLLDRLELITSGGLRRRGEGGHRPAPPAPAASKPAPGCERARWWLPTTRYRAVIAGHTREAGVRDLERKLGRSSQSWRPRSWRASEPVVVDAADVTRLLGKDRFSDEVAERTSTPGVVTGLAVTGAGGGILFIEAATMGGDAGLTLTGQLGDVMSESAEIALLLRPLAPGRIGPRARGRHGEHPPPRAGRRHPQGRPLGGDHHDHRPGQPAVRATGEARRLP